MWLRIFVSAAALTSAASAVSAQSAVSQVATAPPAEPTEERRKAATELIESTTTVRDGVSGLTECGEMAARYQGAVKRAADLEKMNGFLDKLGDYLTAVSVAKHATDLSRTGDASGLVDDAQGLIVSKGGCALFTIFCPVYSAGMGIGTIINYAPKVFGWDNPTLNEMWTDYLVSKLYPVPNDEQIRQGIAELRAQMQKARSDAAAADGRNAQCTAAEVKRKTAIEQMLKKAQPPAVRSSATDYTEGLFGQSAIDAEDPYSSQSLADQQSRKLDEVSQISRDSSARAQAASAAVWQQGLSTLQQAMRPQVGSAGTLPNNAGPAPSAAPVSTTPIPSQQACSNSALPEGMVCTAN